MASSAAVDGSGTIGGAESWPPPKNPAAVGLVLVSLERADVAFRAEAVRSFDKVSSDSTAVPLDAALVLLALAEEAVVVVDEAVEGPAASLEDLLVEAADAAEVSPDFDVGLDSAAVLLEPLAEDPLSSEAESFDVTAAVRLDVGSLGSGSVGFGPPSFGSLVGGVTGTAERPPDPPPPPPPPPPAPAPPPDFFGFSHGFWREPPDPPAPGFWLPECFSIPRSRVDASTMALISLLRRRAVLRVGVSSSGASSGVPRAADFPVVRGALVSNA
jgi:hypothetical protein